MKFFQKKSKEFQHILNERLAQARQWKADMIRWAEQSEIAPSSEQEQFFIAVDLDNSKTVLDKTFMEEFRETHELVSSF